MKKENTSEHTLKKWTRVREFGRDHVEWHVTLRFRRSTVRRLPPHSTTISPTSWTPLARYHLDNAAPGAANTVNRILPLLSGARRLSSPSPKGTSTASAFIRAASTSRKPPKLWPKGTVPSPPRVRSKTQKDKLALRMAGNPAWSVRALSVPGPDTDLALFVSFDDARFLFGAGEAMQRSLVQKRMSLRKLQAIFMMSGSHGRGGLAGKLTKDVELTCRRADDAFGRWY